MRLKEGIKFCSNKIFVTNPVVKGGGRNSGLEMYRIIMMIMIVAHHFVVNSDLWIELKETDLTLNAYFFYVFGAWGKPAIDGFMLITGYFMCKQNITRRKFVKLICQILFYNIVIGSLFAICGKEKLTLGYMYKCIMPFSDVNRNFISCFLLFYLFIPYLNRLVNNINKNEHIKLIMLCLFTYSVLEMMPQTPFSMNYVSWFCVIFFIGAYIRFYSLPKENDTRFWAILTFAFMLIGMCTVVLGIKTGGFTHYFIGEANRPLAIAIAITSFMLFKSIDIGCIRWINMISASTFGVLLIHANSNAMRQWLWNDIIVTKNYLASDYCIIYASLSVLLVFTLCVGIDILRKAFIERPLENILTKYLTH